MAKSYNEQKLENYQIAKQILNAGTEILVGNLVDQSGHINFERLQAILNAYQEALDDINGSIEFYTERINPPQEKGNEE